MNFDTNGTSFFSWWNNLAPGWKVAIGAAVIIGLGVATALTGGTAGVILGAAFSTSIKFAVSGAVSGAVLGGITSALSGENILNGIIGGAADGFAIGAVTGGIFGAASAGIRHLTHSTRIMGSAQKGLNYTRANGTKVTGTFFHRMASNIKGGKMVLSGKYSVVALEQSLKSVGLIGGRMPDVIGIAKNGTNLLVEVTSKSQTYAQMARKLSEIATSNPNSIWEIIGWAAKIGRWFI